VLKSCDSQFNLLHCTISKKDNGKKLNIKKRKISEVPKQSENCCASPEEQEKMKKDEGALPLPMFTQNLCSTVMH